MIRSAQRPHTRGALIKPKEPHEHHSRPHPDRGHNAAVNCDGPQFDLATTFARATQDRSRPWWFGQPLTQADTPNDLIVCNVML